MMRVLGSVTAMTVVAFAVFQSLEWHAKRTRDFAVAEERARNLMPVPPASVLPFVYRPDHPQGPQVTLDANRISAQTELCITREAETRCDVLSEIFRRLPR